MVHLIGRCWYQQPPKPWRLFSLAFNSAETLAMIHELRIYHCAPGRLPDLNKRFETITTKIWERFNIRPIGFWTVLIGANNHDLYYLIEWESLAERETAWTAFSTDPEWLEKRADTEKNGPLITHLDNFILSPTTYSKIQ